jgi:amidase
MRRDRAFGHVRPPSVGQIQKYAARHGMTVDADTAAQLAPAIAGMLALLDVVDELPQPHVPLVHTDRDPGYEPRDDEDEFNAFIRFCTVRGADTGPLAGQRAAIKDCIAVAGVPLTNGSRMLPQLVPTEDAVVVERILAAGATIIGKTNMEDLASGLGETTPFGAARNPVEPRFSAGGSSGGSAAAVAAGLADFALGGDEAGSIRIPAAWCGIVGMKATHGLVPSYGMTYMDHTLDHIGPMTRTVAHNAQVLAVIAGHDDRDPQWVRAKPEPDDYVTHLDDGMGGLRIGVIEESLEPAGCTDATLQTFERVRGRIHELGGIATPVSIPLWSAAWPVELVIIWFAVRAMLDSGGVGHGHLGAINVHAAATLAAQLRTSPDDLALATRMSLIAIEHARDRYLGVHYAKAHNVRRELRNQVNAAFDGVDLLLTPTVPHVAFELRTERTGMLEMVERMSSHAVANTCPLDLTGHPALTVPAGSAEHGLPFGVQLIGPAFAEALLYRAGAALEAR